MEAESSMFETSEMMANFLTSTNLLDDTWRLCSAAKSPDSRTWGFVVDQIGPVGLMAFSGLGDIGSDSGPLMKELVPLDNGLFSGLNRHVDDDCQEPVMVHAGTLQLFLGLHGRPDFRTQMKAMLERSKSIILTGYSRGGAIASLTTLWLLSDFQTIPFPPQVLCITFGSPLLGNDSLSKSLLRQRWNGNFCHVILKHDIVPRLLFSPLASLNTDLHFLLQYFDQLSGATQLTDGMKNQLFGFVLGYTEAAAAAAAGNVGRSTGFFWPFGTYLLCSEDGAVCVDNAISVVKLLHLMLATGNPDSCFHDHLRYGSFVKRVSRQYLMRSGFMQGSVSMSNYEAGLALALESSGLASQESVSEQAKHSLKMAKQMGLTPNLNCARLAISLSKITPHRAQIEWYKSSCDESDDRMGYYDSFKQRQRQASKRHNQANLFRIKLASFWDNVIRMIENNELPHDFDKWAKWINASHFYQLLVEPLDIAEYYRSGEHLKKGHYRTNGRERRHEVFDKWWKARDVVDEPRKRRRFASLTQDSLFWAKVEEARDLLDKVRSERHLSSEAQLWQEIDAFESYAGELIENKEVSLDVLAKNSSYSLWLEEVRKLRSQGQQIRQFAGSANNEMVS